MATTIARGPGEMVGAMDHTWVVGIDGSDCSRHAATWAVQHVESRADALRLAVVWQVPYVPTYPMLDLGVETSNAIEQGARSHLSQLVEELRTRVEVPVDGVLTQGGATAGLLAAADEASLLVVGARGRGGFSRMLLGSTSTQCATHSPVPVAVIPDEADVESVERIVVGVDGSPNSLAALRWAVDFAREGSAIDCVGIWDVSPLTVGNDEFLLPSATGLAERRFHDLVNQAIGTVEGDRVEVRRSFQYGRARDLLLVASQEADLVVVGARGGGGLGALLLGSVSTWLLHHVRCPIVVVPHADDQEEPNGDD
jgi:nucleotide-binding universal stress UspA family protein